ncbi:hypothetical protein ACFWD7_06660 [Streptomyces mirabilis]|uniref:hypothetical protein n=1 Tax=Streptomyces mirabilis TaxID=68239 RepID=UPI0036794590
MDDTRWSAAMEHPTEPEPTVQTARELEPLPCTCGSREHQPLRIGDQLSPTGSAVRTVYVCPAVSATGLEGVL